MTLKASGACPSRASPGRMPPIAHILHRAFFLKAPPGSEPESSDACAHLVSPQASSPTSALCTSGHPASSLMVLLIGWPRACNNLSLLLPSRPQCPPSSQNTHIALLSSFPIKQPLVDRSKEGFSELVVLILGFRKILRLGFTPWLDLPSFPFAALGCWSVRPTGFVQPALRTQKYAMVN